VFTCNRSEFVTRKYLTPTLHDILVTKGGNYVRPATNDESF